MGLMLCIGLIGIAWSVLKLKMPECRYLYATIIVFALALSLQGILQYTGLMPNGRNSFAVTGNFDNPAGFAAALVCIFPLCLLFFTDNNKYLRYAVIAVAAIMATAVFLSGSRAGMMAVAAAVVAWLLVKSKIVNQKSKIILFVLLTALPVVLYFFKKDSADGRLLIWRCTLDMIADKPVMGHGHGAFQAKYMLYQAAYLDAHPDSKYTQLADNVLYPFNEYLLILAEHGIIGISVITFFVFLLVRAYRRNPSGEKLTALLSLLALAMFSFFSYPFRYPFTWVILFIILLGFQNTAGFTHGFVQKFIQNLRPAMFWKHSRSIARITVFLLSAGLLAYTVMLTRAEITWNRIARQSLAGQTLKVLPEYNKLYPLLGENGLFLYNHAAELHEAKEYERSIAVFERCTQYFNDMDVQMLLANNFKELGMYTEAEQHLKTAVAMCPVRFMPLYKLVKLYEACNRKDEALAMAKKIIEKDVKIPSPAITTIMNEMRQLLEAQETSNVSERDRTSDEPKNNKTRQGETSHGTALPP